MDKKNSRDVIGSSKDASTVTGADDSASAGRAIAARKTTILPDFFTGGPDQQWLTWLDDFDLHADVNGWNEEEQRQYLAIRLKGAPREVYRTLTLAEKSSFNALKTALTARFQPFDQAELFRTQFRSRRKQEGERLLDFGMAVRTLASRAFPVRWSCGTIKSHRS